MNPLRTLFLLLVIFATTPALGRAEAPVHHDLEVTLNPSTHRLEVSDRVRFSAAGEWVFYLNEALTLESPPENIDRIAHNKNFVVPVNAYRVTLPEEQNSITLRYSGTIHHGEARESAGVIAEEGVSLAGSSLWYPHVEGAYLSFSLDVSLPEGWRAVSQGARQRRPDGRVRWRETNPQEEIYLIAARFHEYSKPAGGVVAMAFLRDDDAALANRYLDVTARYLEMYRQLIGPYPYAKFALVENFWETGYGMPSFTLLGPKVIRLPFILHSSYPHEILHNWWGNGVYVDYRRGNWAEGLTSYLADHLIQEQRGAALSFRRAILQNYADFVSAGRDFPLAEFTSRHSSSSEAIGYGKAQMLFHMLRRGLGDEAFIRGLHRFYRRYQFKEAGFQDLEQVFQSLAGQDLGPFFQQWVQWSGAPELHIDEVTTSRKGEGWRLQGMLEQRQPGRAYHLSVPMAVTLQNEARAFQIQVTMAEKQQRFSIELPAKPLRLDVDPEFDLFRRVSRAEIPPALSQAFGAEKVLLVLPASASDDTRTAYERMAGAWRRFQFSNVEVVYDNELDALPTDRSVWLLGGRNRFASEVMAALEEYGVSREDGHIKMQQGRYDPSRESIVLTARRTPDDQHALVWLAAERVQAIPGLARKLPHYRKYSYLVFSGDEPENRVKGQWSILSSPMSVRLDGRDMRMAELAPRQPLAQRPAVFD